MRVGNIYSPLEYLYKDGIHALEVEHEGQTRSGASLKQIQI